MITLHTGPAESPTRYQVDTVSGVPRAEKGEGGEGPVFRARLVDPGHPLDGATVALKLLTHVSPVDFTESRARLDAARDLDHPGLMRIIECFIGTALSAHPPSVADDRDVCWVASEWVEGDRLTDRATSAGVNDKLEWTAQIAESLHRLHAARTPAAPEGVLHRDIKTSNVRITPEGDAVLIDFGLARPAAPDTSVVGTPRWMAPEIMAGQPGGTASDTWGVGAIAHDLLIGGPPTADGADRSRERLAHALRSAGHPHADQIAAHLARTLETDPSERPADLAEWGRTLRDARDGNLRDDGGGPRVLVLTSVGLLLVVAMATLVVWLISADEGKTALRSRTTEAVAVATTTPPTPTDYLCDRAPALPDTPPGQRIRSMFTQLDGCAGAVETFGDGLTLQLRTRTSEADGVILAGPTQPAVRLTDAQNASYREIAGRAQPLNSVTYGGYPIRLTSSADPPSWTLELERGGLVIGTRPDTQGFWIPQQAIQTWRASGGMDGSLGRPTSNTFFDGEGLRLEFERGYLSASIMRSDPNRTQGWLPVDVTDIRTVIVDDPSAPLRPYGDLRGRVLRQAGGHAWFVDGDGRRRWVNSSETWGCLHADEHLVQASIPGYAVATLPLGPPASCDG